MAEQNELGTGKIGKLFLRLAIPAILAQLINALYNIVDRMYIGHIEGIGALALTGVGLTFPIIMLISAFASLVGMGGAPLSSIKMGEGNHQKAEKILGNCTFMLLILAVILTAFFLFFKDPLLMAFGASENTLPYASEYLSIYLLGTIFVQISLGLNAFINSQGFAKMGMITVLIGAVLNIILDPVFIFVFDMGVSGAALATILSQAVSAFWVLIFLCGKKTILKIKLSNFPFQKDAILPALALGLSPFVMQSTESLISIVLNSSLQKYGGDIAVGSMTIITSIMQFFLMPLTGMTQGAQPIVGFNFGAKQFDRVKKTFRLLLIACMTFSVVLWGSVMLFPGLFAAVFSSDQELIEYTIPCMRIYMSAMCLMGAQIACQQTFLAVGQAKISLFLAMLRKVILLIPLVYILAIPFGVTGIFMAEPVADLIAVSTTVIVFKIYSKRLFPAVKEKDITS